MKTEVTTLDEKCLFINGGAWKQTEYVDYGIPVVQVKDMQGGTVIWTQPKFLSESSYQQYSQHRLEVSDLVISTVGSHPDQPNSVVGRATIIPKYAEAALLNQNAVCIRPKDSTLDKRYLGYLGQSSELKNFIAAMARGAANQVRIAIGSLKKFQFNLPPLETQERIAEILSNYDNLINNNNRRIALLEESIHLLYKDWFVRLRFPGYESVKVVDGVPEGWSRKTLNDIASSIRQSIHPSNIEANTPYVGLEHIPRQSIALTNWGYSHQVNSNKFIFIKNDILFGKIRPYFHKVVFAPINGICSSDAIVIRPLSKDFFGLALALVSSISFVDYTSKTSKEGSKMPRANWDVMEQYPALIPNSKLLEDFNNLVSLATNQITNLIFMNQRLIQARDLLLPRLMSGKIIV